MKRLPWILYRYIGREIVIISILSLSVLTLLFMIVSGIQAVNKGFQLAIIMPWVLQSIGYSLYFTVPISLLIACTLSYGRIVADKEFTAITASGISPLHLFLPMGTLATILCVIACATQGTVMPHTHYVQRNIARYLVKQLEHLGDTRKGRLPVDEQEGFVYFDESKGGTTMKRVHIEKKLPISHFMADEELDVPKTADGQEPMVQTYIDADYAHLEVDKNAEVVFITLTGVNVMVANPREGFLFEGARWARWFEPFRVQTVTVEFAVNQKKKREGDWTNRELKREIAKHREHLSKAKKKRASVQDEKLQSETEVFIAYYERRIAKADSELWRRRAIALSFFTFAFLGFPLSVTFRHHHRLVPFFLAMILVITVFYPLLLLGETLCISHQVPAGLAMLSGNVALLGIASFLTGRLLMR